MKAPKTSFEARKNQASKETSNEPEAAELYEQIGRLKVQLEWLKKKVAQDGD